MLEDLYVDGFRSLKEFKLGLNPGLNVLVGPNGSGKTNIFRFFEFLSNITDHKILDAVGHSGGANAIFDRAEAATDFQKIHISLKGSTEINTETPRGQTRKREVKYFYSFVITFDKSNSIIKYDKQDLILESKSEKVTARENLRITYRDGEIKQLDAEDVEDYFYLGLSADQLKEFIRSNSHIYKENSLIKFIGQFSPLVRAIVSDINPGKAYNINPESIRKVEDISKEPAIKPDGSGLAATLSYLEMISKDSAKGNELLFYQDRFERYQEYFYGQIIDLVSIVNDDIINLIPKNDLVENRVNIIAIIRGHDRDIEIPLKYLSDGTLKWISIVTAIITSSSIFSIEEPENFLHPKMQKEIINIIRENIGSRKNAFALLTTHSETLINCLLPEEILLTRYKNGYTSASRISNPRLITEEINKTGFGLGWYYNADILDA